MPFSTDEKKVDIDETMNSVKVPDTTFENSNEYAATNTEIYDSIFNQLNKEIFTAQNINSEAEIIKQKTDLRDILINVNLTNTLNAQNGEPEIPLVTAVERRKAIYDQKIDLYSKIGDTERSKENVNLSARATELIGIVDAVKTNIEKHKNPNSSYNQTASQFASNSTPAPKPAEDNAARFK